MTHGKRILVVDDDPAMRFMLGVCLGEEAWCLDEAPSGEAAMARVAAHRYAAVVLDQRMPGLTGIEVARRLRQAGDDTPIALFSAYLHPEVVDEARRLGLEVVDKGDTDGLVAAVRELAA